MKRLSSSSSTPEIGLLHGLLAEAGIEAEIRNENNAFPGAAFQPEIWISDDADYEKACEVRDALQRPEETEAPKSLSSVRSTGYFLTFWGILILLMVAVGTWRLGRVNNWGRVVVLDVILVPFGVVVLYAGAQCRGRRSR
jgi:hypothetical protein